MQSNSKQQYISTDIFPVCIEYSDEQHLLKCTNAALDAVSHNALCLT